MMFSAGHAVARSNDHDSRLDFQTCPLVLLEVLSLCYLCSWYAVSAAALSHCIPIRLQYPVRCCEDAFVMMSA